MAEKILNTRIQLKYDTYENWTTKNPVLKKGEMAIATIATGDTQKVNSVTPPQVLIKVGDGTTNYNALPFASGLAADVYSWAKAASKPSYKASEITGLSDFIGDTIQDTDTQYKIVKDSTNDYKYYLYSKSKDASWDEGNNYVGNTLVSTITIPKYTLPEATASVLGGVKIGSNISIASDGTISLAKSNVTGALGYTPVDPAEAALTGTPTAPTADPSTNSTQIATTAFVKSAIDAIPAQAVYTIEKTTEDANYVASYKLMKDSKQVGETINIPKDYLVKSASCKTATEDDKPIAGLKIGDPYLDFVINTKDTDTGSGTEDHVYINVADLVDVYTAGNGISIDPNDKNKISIKINQSNSNGLSVTEAGLQLETASDTTNGAMSSTSYAELQTAKTDIANLKKVGATKVEQSSVNGNIKINGTETTVYTHPEKHAASEITGLADIATTGNVNDLVQTTGDVLVFDCGNATI